MAVTTTPDNLGRAVLKLIKHAFVDAEDGAKQVQVSGVEYYNDRPTKDYELVLEVKKLIEDRGKKWAIIENYLREANYEVQSAAAGNDLCGAWFKLDVRQI